MIFTILSLVFFLVAIGRTPWFDRFLLRTFTISEDLAQINVTRKNGKLQGTAIIAGGSLAGLFTAIILSLHFTKVVCVESEVLSESTPRRMIPQWNQLHVIGFMTLKVCRRMFDDFDSAVKEVGGTISNAPLNLNKGGRPILTLPNIDFGLIGLSHAKFEPLIRKLLLKTTDNVEIMCGKVAGFEVSNDRIVSVSIQKDGQEISLSAAFLVDCTGSAHASLDWLKTAGYNVPTKQTYSPGMNYRSMTFSLSGKLQKSIIWPVAQPLNECNLVANRTATASLGEQEAVYLQRIEDGRFLLCIMSFGNNHNFANTPEAMFEKAVTLDSSFLFIARHSQEIVAEAAEAGETLNVAKCRLSTCMSLDFAKAKTPSNFACIGDARMQLNPRYGKTHETDGQGIPKALIECVTLDAHLRKVTGDNEMQCFARAFATIQSTRCDGFFDGTKAEDYAFPQTTPTCGENPKSGAFLRFWTSQVVALSHDDPAIGSLFWTVAAGLRPPTDLFAPWIIMQIVQRNLTRSPNKSSV